MIFLIVSICMCYNVPLSSSCILLSVVLILLLAVIKLNGYFIYTWYLSTMKKTHYHHYVNLQQFARLNVQLNEYDRYAFKLNSYYLHWFHKLCRITKLFTCRVTRSIVFEQWKGVSFRCYLYSWFHS